MPRGVGLLAAGLGNVIGRWLRVSFFQWAGDRGSGFSHQFLPLNATPLCIWHLLLCRVVWRTISPPGSRSAPSLHLPRRLGVNNLIFMPSGGRP